MALFDLGQVAATPAALDVLQENQTAPTTLFDRHSTGDWGETCAEDADLNNESVYGDGRIMSVYTMPDGRDVWCITEWDRSVTTLLLPEEY